MNLMHVSTSTGTSSAVSCWSSSDGPDVSATWRSTCRSAKLDLATKNRPIVSGEPLDHQRCVETVVSKVDTTSDEGNGPEASARSRR